MELIKIEHISFAENDILSVHYLKIHIISDQKNVPLLLFEQGTEAPYIANYTLTLYVLYVHIIREPRHDLNY